MDIQKLKQMEQDPEILKRYIGISSFGRNRLIYLPLVAGIGILIFLFLIFTGDMMNEIGSAVIIGSALLSILCFVTVWLMAKRDKQKLHAETTTAPVSIGKIVAGNDNQKVHYCIYATRENRHNEELIDRVKDNIEAACANRSTSAEKKVFDLFRPDDIKPGEFAKKLPLEFTENVEIYRKQVSFKSVSDQVLKQIMETDGGKFPLITIIDENAQFLKEYYS